MRTWRIAALAMIVAIAGTSCRKHLHNAGPITTEERSVASFDKLSVDGSMEVIITQDTTYDVKVEAGERLLRYLKTDVVGSTLQINEESNRIINKRTVRVYVSASVLNDVRLDGSGTIEGTLADPGSFNVELEGSGDIDLNVDASTSTTAFLRGSGDIELTGVTPIIDLELRGSGNIDSRLMTAHTASVFLDGSGDINVFASDTLSVNIYGSGDVYYWGNPTDVNYGIDGSGSLVEMQ